MFSNLFRRARAAPASSVPELEQTRTTATTATPSPVKPETPPPIMPPIIQLSERRALGLVMSLARESLEAGDFPHGAILVHRPKNHLLREARNRELSGEDGDFVPDMLLHAEMALAKWAMHNLTALERGECVVYASGEPCAMCACAMAIVGLKEVVFAASGDQYRDWRREAGFDGGGMFEPTLAAREVVPEMEARGPLEGWEEQVKVLYKVFWERRCDELDGGSERPSLENADTAFRLDS